MPAKRTPPNKKATNAQFKAALKKNGGLAAHAARDLGMTRQGVSQRIRKSPELQAFLAELDQTHLDTAEGVVLEAIANKDLPTARWYLERKGKKRGYATKVETEGKIADADLEALVGSLGGDLSKLRAIRDALRPPSILE